RWTIWCWRIACSTNGSSRPLAKNRIGVGNFDWIDFSSSAILSSDFGHHICFAFFASLRLGVSINAAKTHLTQRRKGAKTKNRLDFACFARLNRSCYPFRLMKTGDSQVTQIMAPHESLAAISVGDVLRGRYRLDSFIGRGGMGIVYRATDLELMREVAIKVVSEATSSDSRDRFIREARAAAALNHPKIISVYDVGESHGTPFFV